jgi:hypothetical protein
MRTAGLLVAVNVLALVAACSGPFGEDPEELAASAAGEFLDSWSAGDLTKAAQATDSPQRARGRLAQVREDLQIASTAYELSGEATCGQQRCVQPVRLTQSLAGLGDWSYRSEVVIDRPPGEAAGYRVAWSPRIVHPRLTEQTDVSR